MDGKTFDHLMSDLLEKSTKVLSSAEKEYASEEDRLSNFKQLMPTTNPDLVCFIYLTKHIDGIKSYVTGRAKDQRDSIQGRITDAINYLILLNAIIMEMEEEEMKFIQPKQTQQDPIYLNPR